MSEKDNQLQILIFDFHKQFKKPIQRTKCIYLLSFRFMKNDLLSKCDVIIKSLGSSLTSIMDIKQFFNFIQAEKFGQEKC